jgi:hypothetical protein
MKRLSGRQTDTGGKLLAIVKRLAITISGHDRRGTLRTDALYGTELLAGHTLAACFTPNLLVVLLEALTQRAEGCQQLG